MTMPMYHGGRGSNHVDAIETLAYSERRKLRVEWEKLGGKRHSIHDKPNRSLPVIRGEVTRDQIQERGYKCCLGYAWRCEHLVDKRVNSMLRRRCDWYGDELDGNNRVKDCMRPGEVVDGKAVKS